MLREFEINCEPAFNVLARTSWSSVNQVSGPSPYTSDIVKAAEQVVEVFKPLVEQKKYLRNLFDKACGWGSFTLTLLRTNLGCSLILGKFTNAIVKSRPLKEIGAEQVCPWISADVPLTVF